MLLLGHGTPLLPPAGPTSRVRVQTGALEDLLADVHPGNAYFPSELQCSHSALHPGSLMEEDPLLLVIWAPCKPLLTKAEHLDIRTQMERRAEPTLLPPLPLEKPWACYSSVCRTDSFPCTLPYCFSLILKTIFKNFITSTIYIPYGLENLSKHKVDALIYKTTT